MSDWDEQDRQRAIDAQQQMVRQRIAARLDAVPKRFRGGFDGLEGLGEIHRQAARDLRRWTETFDSRTEMGWYISGPTGSGKTALAYAAMQGLCRRDIDVIFRFVPDLFAELRAAINENAIDAVVDDLTQVDCLVLDDLAAEFATDWTVKTLAQIVDRRYRDCKPIVVTSNLTGTELLRHIDSVDGQRIVSRLCEMVWSLPLDGVDLRKRKAPDQTGGWSGARGREGTTAHHKEVVE